MFDSVRVSFEGLNLVFTSTDEDPSEDGCLECEWIDRELFARALIASVAQVIGFCEAQEKC